MPFNWLWRFLTGLMCFVVLPLLSFFLHNIGWPRAILIGGAWGVLTLIFMCFAADPPRTR